MLCIKVWCAIICIICRALRRLLCVRKSCSLFFKPPAGSSSALPPCSPAHVCSPSSAHSSPLWWGQMSSAETQAGTLVSVQYLLLFCSTSTCIWKYEWAHKQTLIPPFNHYCKKPNFQNYKYALIINVAKTLPCINLRIVDFNIKLPT